MGPSGATLSHPMGEGLGVRAYMGMNEHEEWTSTKCAVEITMPTSPRPSPPSEGGEGDWRDTVAVRGSDEFKLVPDPGELSTSNVQRSTFNGPAEVIP